MHRYLVFILFLYTIQIYAKEPNKYVKSHEIGITAGISYGVGIAYRAFYENRLGFQTGIGILGVPKDFVIIGGMHMFYTIKQYSPNLRFYFLGGLNSVLEPSSKFVFLPGIGMGAEFNIYKNLAMAFDILLAPMVPIGKMHPILGYTPLPYPSLALFYHI